MVNNAWCTMFDVIQYTWCRTLTKHRAQSIVYHKPSIVHKESCTASSMLHQASCTKHLAPSNLHHALRTKHLALHQTLCTKHRAPHIVHQASYTKHPALSILHKAQRSRTNHRAPIISHQASYVKRPKQDIHTLPQAPSILHLTTFTKYYVPNISYK